MHDERGADELQLNIAAVCRHDREGDLVNHDGELKVLGIALKRTLKAFDSDICDVCSAKHRTELKQDMDMAFHYMIKMCEKLDDLNAWLTAFGPGSDYQ